jgi:hypothetical protein
LSKLAPVRKRKRKTEGRVDVLAERLLERAVENSTSELLQDVFAATRVGIRQLLRSTVGPRTRRGRQIAENLFAAREAVARVQEARQRRRL